MQRLDNQQEDAAGTVLTLQYGPAATVWRMNFGWRRRKEKSILGFMINPVTGHWVGGAEESGEADADTPPDKTPPQRIVPYVEDRRNILIIRPPETYSAVTMATLQYALKRGIEAIYQLEESELMTEPLPSRDNRQAILFYESAEGGAGVLTRLATEPDAFARVAEEALRIMHYLRPQDGIWKKEELTQEQDADGNPTCEAGCYKCLLSYYNQPDHTLIDRQDIDNDGKALEVLIRLTRATGKIGTFGRSPDEQKAELARISGSSLEQAWLAHVEAHDYRAPDRGQETIAECHTCADFFYQDWKAAIFIDGPHHDESAQKEKDSAINLVLEDAGYYVVRFPKEQALWETIFQQHADLFGQGSKN